MTRRDSLLNVIPPGLRKQLLSEFDRVVESFDESRWGSTILRSGRFCEIVYSILNGYSSPSGFPPRARKPRNFLEACRRLEDRENDPSGKPIPRSFRILLPRLLPALYEVRNNRGAHATEVDPNEMDSVLLVMSAKWIISELIRVLANVSLDRVQAEVDDLARSTIRGVWKGPSGKKRVIDPKAPLSEKILLLLSDSGGKCGISRLKYWVGPKGGTNFRRMIEALEKRNFLVMERRSVRLLKAGREALAQSQSVSRH